MLTLYIFITKHPELQFSIKEVRDTVKMNYDIEYEINKSKLASGHSMADLAS